MTTIRGYANTTTTTRGASVDALTPSQVVALYLVLAPVPGGRWLRQLVRRHPAEAGALLQASHRWARAGSKAAVHHRSL